MKFYSELTKQLYDNEKACKEAELALQEKQNAEKVKKEKELAERKAAAEKVEVARKNMVTAQKEYKKVLSDFCAKYGTYHTSLSTKDSDDFYSIFDLFHLL